MRTTTLKLVTIVAERILQERLCREVLSFGATGYTLTETTGKGSRGTRAHEWEGPDVKIEAVVSPEVADEIVAHVAEEYFEHYAVIVYVQDAEVVRGNKYV